MLTLWVNLTSATQLMSIAILKAFNNRTNYDMKYQTLKLACASTLFLKLQLNSRSLLAFKSFERENTLTLAISALYTQTNTEKINILFLLHFQPGL